MSKKINYLFLFIGLAATAGFVYWQFVKKKVVKSSIQTAVEKESDSRYKVSYDSSAIDELGGNATFYNLKITADSSIILQYQKDTSLKGKLYDVRVERLEIRGANIPSFLQKNTIEATTINIVKPFITIVQFGKIKTTPTAEDSIALFEQLTGKFNKIHAGEINVVDAVIALADDNNAPHTTLQDVNVNLQNFKIDSTRNYNNIISYFVKDIVITAKTATTVNKKNGQIFIASGIKYSAPSKLITINEVLEKQAKADKPVTSISGIRIAGINTNAFVRDNALRADSLVTSGGNITIYTSKKTNAKSSEISVDNDFFDVAQVKNIVIGPTDLRIINKAKATSEPMLLKKVEFTASNIGTVYDGTNLQRLLATTRWKLSSAGTRFTSKDKLYNIDIGRINLDKTASTIQVQNITMIPTMSWAQFVKKLIVQNDLFNIAINNILITGVDVQALVDNQQLIADAVSMQPNIKIYNDRTVPMDPKSKVGKYPQQQLLKVEMPIAIKKLNVTNGAVLYRERGLLSKQTGDVTFTNINGSVSNVTNVKEVIKDNPNMVLQVNAMFLGAANINTTWTLPLNSTNGSFTVSGNAKPFDATILTKITQPLGMAAITKGKINGLTYTISGNDLAASGKATLLYDNLKIALLKTSDGSANDLEKKSLISFAANLFTKNSNPKNGETREGKIDLKRELNKSFFFLVWRSIFLASKRIASGKDDY